MNRKYLSFLVLFFTTVTIGGMFYLVENNYSKSLKSNSDISFENRQYKEYDSSKEESNNKVDKKLENDKEHIVSYDKNYKVLGEEKDLNEHSKSVDDLIDDKVAKKKVENYAENRKIKDKRKKTKDFIENNNSNIEKEYIKNNNTEKKLDVENIKVFKVDKHSIPKKISRKDKLKLMSIAKNLSISDYFELLENIKRNDELDAAIDIFRILKDKLDEEEYNLLKDIMDPYINIQLIEEKI